MRESIGARVGRIISGSFNSIVDAVENAAPELVMEQAVREVDGAIDDVRAELGKVVANKHLASKRLMDANSRHDDLASKIDLAVTEKRDDLAEVAISQQLDLEAQMPVLESTVKDCAEKEKELEGFISALQAKRREMKEELSAFRTSRQEAPTAADGRASVSGSDVRGKVEKAESAFDRVLERQTGLPGAGSDLANAGKLAELEDLARKNRIQERLAAAKAGGDPK